MAKRAVQLQAELQTDEDFENFVMTRGLLVVEVYTEWCGPCLGMIGTLRRVKMDVGDDLNLAIAKSDTISYINRFYKRSEPTWLFITEGQAVNIMFGTDAPRLTTLIYEEIKLLPKFSYREKYGITELQPEETIRHKIKNEAKEAKLQQENHERLQKKMHHFNSVTDIIEENLPDIGVTIFGPHIHRDYYRKIIDFGVDKFGIQCKDRRNQPITKEQFEIINTVCKNPLPQDVIDAMEDKDLFICYWKIPDAGTKVTVMEVLEAFAEEITKPTIVPPDEYRDNEEIIPPLISSIKIKVEYKLPEDEECPHEDFSDAEHETDAEHRNKDQKATHEESEANLEEFPSEMGIEEDEEQPVEDQNQQNMMDQPFNNMGLDIDIDPLSDMEYEDEETEEVPEKNVCLKTIVIPGVWVPKDKRTHAALIYVLFRTQTLTFLPPDPVPEPPHLIMAFDTYKQRDLINFAERYKDDVPLYGYFTSDDADEAKFIANSKEKYAHQQHSPTDKLVFKVNKRTSHTMLSLVTYGPTYVSFNTEIGQEEAKKFFPEDYASEEKIVEHVEEESPGRKSKKGKELRESASSKSKEVKPEVHEDDVGGTIEHRASDADVARSGYDVDAEGEGIGEGEVEGDGEGQEGYGEGAGEGEGEVEGETLAATEVIPENIAETVPTADATAIEENPA